MEKIIEELAELIKNKWPDIEKTFKIETPDFLEKFPKSYSLSNSKDGQIDIYLTCENQLGIWCLKEIHDTSAENPRASHWGKFAIYVTKNSETDFDLKKIYGADYKGQDSSQIAPFVMDQINVAFDELEKMSKSQGNKSVG